MLFACFYRLLLVFILTIPLEASLPQEVLPYIMPEDHPIKAGLDALFSSNPSLESFNRPISKRTRLFVGIHPDFPGYIFKFLPNTNPMEHEYWLNRIRTANIIRNAIEERGFGDQFKVPQKWLYVLPSRYLLVAEDMNILPTEENKALWKSSYVTPELLYNLFVLLRDLHLRDCCKPDNIPFSRDGRIAFVDTQFFEGKMKYKRLSPSLSPSNQIYWKVLTKS